MRSSPINHYSKHADHHRDAAACITQISTQEGLGL